MFNNQKWQFTRTGSNLHSDESTKHNQKKTRNRRYAEYAAKIQKNNTTYKAGIK